MKLLIKKGHVLDLLTGLDDISGVLVEDNRIVKVAKDIHGSAGQAIDASGCYVMPGLTDQHVHLRDP